MHSQIKSMLAAVMALFALIGVLTVGTQRTAHTQGNLDGLASGATPFQITLNSSTKEKASYKVPVGQRLVIEYVSVFGIWNPNGYTAGFPTCPFYIGLVTTTGGTTATHNLPGIHDDGANNGTILYEDGGGMVHLYADTGTTVFIDPVSNTLLPNLNVTISGHLVRQ